jgi:hypothetical protein
MFRDEVKGIKKWLILEPEVKANCRKIKVGRNYGRRRRRKKSVIAYCNYASYACIQLLTVLFFTKVRLFRVVIVCDGTLTINVFY